MKASQTSLAGAADETYLRIALRLSRRGYGTTSPNPMVGAVLVKSEKIIGRGWHRRAGEPHAEIEALRDAQEHGHSPRGAALYVTLEPCSTHGRTPPCTDAIIGARIQRVVVGAMDPNPLHSGKAFGILKRAGIAVMTGVLADECERLNETFNHWIVQRAPFVSVKAAMTLDGKIATASGESKWITGERARAYGMRLRQGADAILVGINTVLADNPSLTVRDQRPKVRSQNQKHLRRIILDSQARTPIDAKVVSDQHAALTTIVVSKMAPQSRVAALARRVKIWMAPIARATPPGVQDSKAKVRPAKFSRFKTQPLTLDLRWLLKKLGAENVTSLLVEGGGEVNGSFLLQDLAQRVVFFYAPKILGGRDSCPAVAGQGVAQLEDALRLNQLEWRKVGPDLLLTARIVNRKSLRGPRL